VTDKAEALLALCEGATGVPEVQARIETIFSDVQAGKCVVLSSVHRAKGLEWDRVFLLADTFTRKGDEEDNVRYVAITRAKSELVWVTQ
jgi:superfamily I DNA/RNA helicase